MRTILLFISLAMALLPGCSAPPPPPAPPPFNTVLNLKQFMEWVMDPAADAVWESVKTIVTQKGTEEIAPKTEEQWAAVRAGAATLTEAGNMLMIEGRAKDNKEWMAAARRLITAAEVALKAANAKNSEAVFASGTEIYNACAACHKRYAPELSASQPPVTLAALPLRASASSGSLTATRPE
jgi:mono/diheme cytochrome c family protein